MELSVGHAPGVFFGFFSFFGGGSSFGAGDDDDFDNGFAIFGEDGFFFGVGFPIVCDFSFSFDGDVGSPVSGGLSIGDEFSIGVVDGDVRFALPVENGFFFGASIGPNGECAVGCGWKELVGTDASDDAFFLFCPQKCIQQYPIPIDNAIMPPKKKLSAYPLIFDGGVDDG